MKRYENVLILYKGLLILSLIIALLTARVFSFLEIIRVLRKERRVAALLGIHLSVQVHKKVKFSERDISFLAVKGLRQFFCFDNIYK